MVMTIGELPSLFHCCPALLWLACWRRPPPACSLELSPRLYSSPSTAAFVLFGLGILIITIQLIVQLVRALCTLRRAVPRCPVLCRAPAPCRVHPERPTLRRRRPLLPPAFPPPLVPASQGCQQIFDLKIEGVQVANICVDVPSTTREPPLACPAPLPPRCSACRRSPRAALPAAAQPARHECAAPALPACRAATPLCGYDALSICYDAS